MWLEDLESRSPTNLEVSGLRQRLPDLIEASKRALAFEDPIQHISGFSRKQLWNIFIRNLFMKPFDLIYYSNSRPTLNKHIFFMASLIIIIEVFQLLTISSPWGICFLLLLNTIADSPIKHSDKVVMIPAIAPLPKPKNRRCSFVPCFDKTQ